MPRASEPPIVSDVAAFIRRRGLMPPGARVAAAVSGGSDSVALFKLLLALEPVLDITVAGLIHVNHQLRGLDAEADEQFCRTLAAVEGKPVHVERVEVRRTSSAGQRQSPEDAAREARYAALDRGAAQLGAELVALGHTEDDQAETVLFRLLRGAGPDGLAGIPDRRGRYVRPLLETRRSTLRAWLTARGQPWVEDATNADRSVPRNAIRHDVLPAASRIMPRASSVLARHAAIARDDAEWVASVVNPVVARLVHQESGRVLVDAALLAEPVAVQRRAALAALRLSGARHPGFDEVEAVRALLGSQDGARDLPGGLRANRTGPGVVLILRGVGTVLLPDYRYMLRVPGEVEVPEASALVAAAPKLTLGVGGAASIEIDVDGASLGDALVVRNWRPGDLIRPAGLGGRKKLQDVFVDAKVPRPERRRLPLLADSEGRVLWVPGLALDERLRVTSGTKAVVVLRLTRKQAQPVGGPE
jgi:tRNA(Ile)-lysidine synthase